MAWKMYSLGTTANASNVASAAVPILEGLGYSPRYTNTNNAAGVISVTIGGTLYSADLYVQTSTSYPYYLFVNDETNDILITISHQSGASPSMAFGYAVCFAILSGTDLLSGAAGMFPIQSTDYVPTKFSNIWTASIPADVIVLQKALFFENADRDWHNVSNVESTLYFGSSAFSPGVVVSIGADRFVCLAGRLFAKL